MKQAYLIFSICCVLIFGGCYKKSNYNNAIFNIKLVTENANSKITWTALNSSEFINYEIIWAKSEADLNNSSKRKTLSKITNPEETSFILSTLLLDTLMPTQKIFLQLITNLKDRFIVSNVLQVNGTAVNATPDLFFLDADLQHKKLLYYNYKNGFYDLYIFDIVTEQLKKVNIANNNSSTWKFIKMPNQHLGLINTYPSIIIIDAETFEEKVNIPHQAKGNESVIVYENYLVLFSRQVSPSLAVF
jgi:hypothetical protein